LAKKLKEYQDAISDAPINIKSKFDLALNSEKKLLTTSTTITDE
jgi:hypothetical protein